MDNFYFDLYQHRTRAKKTGFYDIIHSFFQTSFFITMQKLTILAAAVLFAGAANAQQVSTAGSTYRSPAFTPLTPFTPGGVTHNAPVNGANAGSPAPTYNSYNQDSRVDQSGTHNEAVIDQVDARSGATGGSTANLVQSGNFNTATQNQASAGNITAGRNTMYATQAGTRSQSNQSQYAVDHTAAQVSQDANSSANRAIQNQASGTYQSAYIHQTGSSSGNRAQQSQVGGSTPNVNGQMTTVIEQQGLTSYARQIQSGLGDDAGILQGVGANNTAMQTQSGRYLNASIKQTGAAASGNYAKQDQTGYSNNASIEQHSANNYAEQAQGNGTNAYQNNTSVITQNNVSSAAYTSQTGGAFNTVVVTQH